MTNPSTTPLTYNGYVTQVATMAVVNTTTTNGVVVGVDASFNAIIPQMLNYAELRIQRDMDLLQSQVENSTYALTANSNKLAIDVDDFVTLQTFQVTAGGVSTPLLPSTKEFLQNVYGSVAGATVPMYFAPYGGDLATFGSTTQTFIVGPWPDQNYPVVLTGTVRMQTLYAKATTALAATGVTFISTYLPDLLIMASMIYLSAFQRNFGRQADDPAMAQSYENHYQLLLKGATMEEYRKKFEADGWTSESTPVAATLTRG